MRSRSASPRTGFGGLAFLAVTVLVAAGVSAASPALAAPVSRQCSAMSFTWTGNGNGSSWGDPMNWSPPTRAPGSCPGVDDSVDIPIEANITGAPSASFNDFTIESGAGSDGTLTGGPLTVTNHFEWDGSSLEVTVNLPAGSTGTIAGHKNIESLGGPGLGIPGRLNVSGVLTLANVSGDGGELALGASVGQGTIDVQRGGELVAVGQNSVDGLSCCSGSDVPTVRNLGAIDVTTGRLTIGGALFYQLGQLDVASHALLDADGPTTLGNRSGYTGSGRMLLDLAATPTTLAGTLSLGKGFDLDLGPQACLQGSGTITGPGSFDFTGGYIAAALTIDRGAFMHVTGPDGKDLRDFGCGTTDGTIVNKGKILVDQGALSLGAAGTISTDAGATFAIAPGATVTTDSCCGTKKLLVSNGVLQVTSPPKGVRSGSPATLNFVPLAASGTINVADGQELLISGAPTSFATGAAITGTGGKTVIEAPLSVGKLLSIGSKSELDLAENGSLAGAVSIAGAGALRWTGGSISGAVSVAKTVPVTISGTVDHAVVNRPDGAASVLTTLGAVTFRPGTAKAVDSVEIGGPDSWVSAGTLKVARYSSISTGGGSSSGPSLDNAGTMTVAAGRGQTTIELSEFLNAGKLNLASGKLEVDGAYQQAATGTLAVTFSGTSPGTGFGQLKVSGSVTLAGSLDVSTKKFAPHHGASFPVMAYESRTGKFSKLAGKPAYRLSYHVTSMDVVFR
jgi:hypothetical protein